MTLLVRAGNLAAGSCGTGGPGDRSGGVGGGPPRVCRCAVDPMSSRLAPRQPAQIARLLQQIEATGVTYDAQWLRLYRALDEVASSDFDELAATHLDSPNQRWLRRLPACAVHGPARVPRPCASSRTMR